MDIAPTILYLFGQEIPDDMDGKVLMEAFDKHYLKTHPIKYKRAIKRAPKEYRTQQTKGDKLGIGLRS